MQIGPYKLKNPWILAPMAGVSEMPFRKIALEMGASAAPTELVSAKGLLAGQARTERYMRYDPKVEKPFWVQIFGGDPEAMGIGAERAAELGAEIIDVNMGCPVRKVTSSSAGSALLRDPKRAAQIVETIKTRTGLPVTVKIRAGWDPDSLNYVELAKHLEGVGCAAIAMHARTRQQGYDGAANWHYLKDLVDHTTIPVIGNGDTWTAEDARQMLRTTGCAAVMIGRGALGNPWIFRYLTGHAEVPTLVQRLELIERHYKEHLEFVDHPLKAVRQFRQQLIWYVGTLDPGRLFINEVLRIDEPELVLAKMREFFRSNDNEPSAWRHARADIKGALG
jgi:nifR3 family TIM-barrel protein